MILRLVFTCLWIACAVFSVQAESVNCTSEYIESIYNELPKTKDGGVVDSIGFFQIRVTSKENKIQDLGVRIDNLEFDNPYIKGFVERKMLELLLAADIDKVILALNHSKCRLFYNGMDYDNGLLWSLKDGVEVFRNCTGFNYQTDGDSHRVSVKSGRNRLDIEFPVNIQVVTDKNKMELESELNDLLHSDFGVDITTRPSANSRYSQVDDIYATGKEFLFIEAISDVTYYNFDGFGFEPIFSMEHAVESFINMFHIANDKTCNIDLAVTQWLYGSNRSKSFTVSLDKLIAYCRANDIKVYVGIEGRKDNVVEGSILLESKDLKFLHVLHVKSDISTLLNATDSKRGRVSVNLYAYVPTDNIGNIFDDNNYQKRENKFLIEN